MIAMLFAWVKGIERAPEVKRERATCNDCGGQLTIVIPFQNVLHWRHLAGECDLWSEPEGHDICGGNRSSISESARLASSIKRQAGVIALMFW